MKSCTKCKQLKARTDFSPNRAHKDGLQSACAQCRKLQAKEKRDFILKQNPHHFRNKTFKRRYGIDHVEKEKMMGQQKNKCFVCLNDFNQQDSMLRPCLDHNHTTSGIRKVLCMGCNSALGMIRENFDTALRLAKYIQDDQGLI